MINLAKVAPLESGIQNKDLTMGILWQQLVFTACLLLFLSEKSHSLLTLFEKMVFGNNLNQTVFFFNPGWLCYLFQLYCFNRNCSVIEIMCMKFSASS